MRADVDAVWKQLPSTKQDPSHAGGAAETQRRRRKALLEALRRRDNFGLTPLLRARQAFLLHTTMLTPSCSQLCSHHHVHTAGLPAER